MRAVAIALILAIGATTARADDDPLAEAIRLEAALDYQAALVIVERAITQGTADHDRLVTLHLFAGKLAAGLDRTPVALDHFARVLALAPATTFAEGTSPKITEPFDLARARTVPLQVTATVERDAITIVPTADPLGLATGIAVRVVEGKRTRDIRDLQRRRVAIPAGARPSDVFALDAFGNQVWSQAIAAPPPPPVAHASRSWAIWGTASILVLGGAGVCAWRFDLAQKEWTERKDTGMATLSELQAIERRGKRWALAANIGFGAAAATAIIATIAFVRTPRAVPVVTASGDAVGLALRGDL